MTYPPGSGSGDNPNNNQSENNNPQEGFQSQGQYGQGQYGQDSFNQAGAAQPYGSAGESGSAGTAGTSPTDAAGTQGFQETRAYADPSSYGAHNQGASQPQFGQGLPPYGSYANQAYPTPVQSQESFFGALFDFTFTKYATPSVAKILYVLLMVGVAVFSLLLLVLLLVGSTKEDGGMILLILGVPLIAIGAVAALALYRVYLEMAVGLIRTSESVQRIDERQDVQMRQQYAQQGGQGYDGQAFGGQGQSFYGG